ncbi:unnamed protein product [Chondrus crispus]|uniref:Uncharacterized protein n=1 Tax=Chondrus crispus TaxID=2769 RepID=R7QQE0_CHOCR|nr:unnamed protein product [Chondrus crispus]CDF40717.1 unnamed protein product [Chondrus crispus]|eukprot:XP_005711011.1 unnamed protein product [Chondrus crispus]
MCRALMSCSHHLCYWQIPGGIRGLSSPFFPSL